MLAHAKRPVSTQINYGDGQPPACREQVRGALHLRMRRQRVADANRAGNAGPVVCSARGALA